MARTKASPSEQPLIGSAIVESVAGRLEGAEVPLQSIDLSVAVRAKRNEMIQAAYSHRSRFVGDMVKSLTAAAEVLDPTEGSGPMPNAVSRTWQHAVYGYSRVVPELGVAAMYVGNCLSRCSLAVGKRNADGSVEQGFDGTVPVADLNIEMAAAASEAIASLQAVRGGQSELLRSFGEKDFLCGEAFLVPEDQASGLRFECLSVNEIMRTGNSYSIYYGPGYDPKKLPSGVKPIRIWRADAQYGRVATSSVRSCIEILEELAILTRLVRASAISRMALSGILAIAEEFDTPQNNSAPGSTSEEAIPFFVDMVNTGAKAIDDPASAAAWSPFLLVGPKDLIQTGIRYIKLAGDDQENVIKRAEALQRLAQGLDLPVEVIMGHQSTTFANAAQVNEDVFKLHIEPALERLCDALTVAYLWPALAKQQGMTPAQIRNNPYPDDILSVAVTYDASKLISRPDRASLVLELFWRDKSQTSVRLSEVRDALGLDPDQIPDDKEVARRIDAIRLANIKETIAAPTSDAAVPLADASAGKAVIPGASKGAAALESKIAPAEPALNASAQILSFMVAGAAEVTIERAMERIGARLRAKAKGVDLEVLTDIDNGRVASILGPAAVKRLLGRDAPAAAELRAFGVKVAEWATDLEFEDPKAMAQSASTLVTALLLDALYASEATPVRVSAPACIEAFTATAS